MALPDRRRSVSQLSSRRLSNETAGKHTASTGASFGFAIPDAWRRQTTKNSSISQAFYHAFVGILAAVRTERVFKLHLALSALAVALGVATGFDPWQWVACALAFGLIVALEMVNTAVERLTDLVVNNSYHPLAQEAKDVAAGAVLFAIFLAIAVLVVCVLTKWNVLALLLK